MDLMLFALISAGAALIFVVFTAIKVLRFPQGNEKIVAISKKIQLGASSYLRRQYVIVSLFFAAMFALLFIIAFFFNGIISKFVPFAFIAGGFFSALSGFIGMKIATAANSRTANAAHESLDRGLRVAFSAGSVMGFTVVGLGLFFISAAYFVLKYLFNINDMSEITFILLTFSMGTSSMALFARVGGGIFTKAADVGADLVGKVEKSIPENDPRNPAVIADNVGDNVGDVAGMGADLYESYVGSIISASALGISAVSISGVVFNELSAFALPMILAAVGIISSIIGTLFVRTKNHASQKKLLGVLRRGTGFSALLTAIAAFPLIWFILGPEHIGMYGAVLSGLVAGLVIGLITEYYTSDTYKPTKKLAASAKTGSATIIISGLSLGMLSTILPVLVIAASIFSSFLFSGGMQNHGLGLYGIAISAVGMLSTLGITLATDAYGPVADNAGGIAEMAGLPPEVLERTNTLDSLGNTTAATGKGFAIGSAVLTSLALISTYVDRINILDPTYFSDANKLSITNPFVLIGLLLGAALPFLFSALTMQAVSRAAQSIVVEVRRQWAEIKGLSEGTADADYSACIDICVRASLREMIIPTLIAIAAPILAGFLLGPGGVVGLLAGALISGFLLALMMTNSGGAWDNAKKYIEAGNLNGKGSENHKASVVGDTVGDPFKDTSGPAINILIKLLSIVSIVFAGLVLSIQLF